MRSLRRMLYRAGGFYCSFCKGRSIAACSLLVVWTLVLIDMGFCAEVPTIEKLTGGKVKTGELITQANVESIKQWLAPSTYEQVKRGMVLFVAPTTPVEETVPEYFLDATKKRAGLAVMGKNSVVYTKDGKKWPGGLPFSDPKTGEEAMVNNKFSSQLLWADDLRLQQRLDWVDKTGKSYKYSLMGYRKMASCGRLKTPPLPCIPGYEDEAFRVLLGFSEPDFISGIRLLFIRYYDSTARPDDVYLYTPALRRTRATSLTNWQESMGGSDLTWGDAQGFLEPLSLWNFKLIGRANMVMPGQDNPAPKRNPDGSIFMPIPTDKGSKFVRMYWEVRPVVIVEAKPKGPHIYGKQIFYLDELNWRKAIIERHDRQGKLWKAWTLGGGILRGKDGINYTVPYYGHQYDMQVDHMTRVTTFGPEFNVGQDITDFSVKKMIDLQK